MSLKQLLCRFNEQGTCNFGDECIFSHNSAEAVPIPEDACLFFIRMNCIYGNECRNKHQTIEEIVKQNFKTQTQLDSTMNVVQIPPSEEMMPKESVNNAIQRKSYASVASVACEKDQNRASVPLCTFYESNGFCVYPNCSSIHGDYCDLCGFFSIHPFNKEQNDLHRAECIKEHEESMEISFAYQRSKELTCAICLDVVLDKEPRKNRRFGILINCNHIYCIDCIRTWRNSDVDKKNKRRCPQCRVKSDFIIPSAYFYDNEEKQKLIKDYKQALGSKHCKYFKRGEGSCPFQGACFYKHEYPDGRKAVLSLPSKLPKTLSLRFPDLSTVFSFDELDDYSYSTSDLEILNDDEPDVDFIF